MKQLFILLFLLPLFSFGQTTPDTTRTANDTTNTNKEVLTVQVQARFPGGVEGWLEYLQKNLKVNTPVKHKSPRGNYTVIVSFLVDTNGDVSEVRAETDPGYGTAEEAVRVLRKSPKWIPATQDGKKVIYRQKQSITFQVN